ncbi:membrane protein [Fulvitalea axinellae]|uniref:Membrane protein n=2 Tax=Fulvitalea axinellae TaxID=1182444 RepID=A0AAU9DHE0_9BACT|nr:membrane protein [Fulvitalea axinellae]
MFAQAGDSLHLGLTDAVRRAKANSIDALYARTSRDISLQSWRLYKATLRPDVLVSGQLPGINRRYEGVRQPDGSVVYQEVFQGRSELDFSLRQVIPFTGGNVSLYSSLDRFDNFDSENRGSSYSGSPVGIRLDQPLFAYNDFRWKKQIEPLNYKASERKYVESMEKIGVQAATAFFDLYSKQREVQRVKENIQRANIKLSIAKKRFSIGTITENDLLQLELSTLKSQEELAQAELDYAQASRVLRRLLDLDPMLPIKLDLPAEIPGFVPEPNFAAEIALKNRPDMVEAERDLLQAKAGADRARKEGFSANLNASAGWDTRTEKLDGYYKDMIERQTVSVRLSVPIVDWGKNKARKAQAESRLRLAEISSLRAEENVSQEASVKASRLVMARRKIGINERSMAIAKKRYEIASKRYDNGDLSVLELITALREMDEADRGYVKALQSFWNEYYGLRAMTLYDFETGQSLLPEE